MKLKSRIGAFAIIGLSALLVGAFLVETSSLVTTDPPIRVMTFNIRYHNPGDGVHAWPQRKDRVASMIRFHRADVVGVQEALRGQVDTLAAMLPGYAWFGIGRDDGVEAGEFSPIFYRKDRFDLIEGSTFWLSETPDEVGSRGWDAALPRIVTWGRFRDKRTGATFFLLNTHFDHQGQLARIESARLLLEKMTTLADEAPGLVTGDFNVEPSSEAYRVLAGSLIDAREQTASPPHGPEGTFRGFIVEAGAAGSRIDYIFVQPDVAVQSFGALTDHWDGYYPSDHLPVLAEIVLP